MSRPYKHIAELYSHLMKFIDYSEWAEYYLQLSDGINAEEGVLELAAGNCKMASYLKVHYPGLIATDISADMLMQAADKDLRLVCCDMRYLPFKTRFGLIISAFDSINYLTTKTSLNQLFRGIKKLLTDSGIFTFDVSLEKNSIKNIKYLNRKGNFKGMKYIQKSEYDRDSRIHLNQFTLMLSDGRIIKETHRQKIYPLETYFGIIEDNGLYVKHCYDAFSFDDVNAKSDRAQFVISKRSQNAFL